MEKNSPSRSVGNEEGSLRGKSKRKGREKGGLLFRRSLEVFLGMGCPGKGSGCRRGDMVLFKFSVYAICESFDWEDSELAREG